jgi:glutamate/aspartate transport system permease protein
MSYHWNWGVFWELSPEGNGSYADMMLQGFVTTLLLSLVTGLLAFIVGSAIGVLRSASTPLAQRFAVVWIEFFRNVPLLVQLFLWYFVLPEVLPRAWGDWLKALSNAPFLTAVVGIGLFMSARVAVQVAAGIDTVPAGIRDATTALSLTTFTKYRFVLLPMAYRAILPTLTSEAVNTIKNSSVALTIGVMELTARARAIQEFSFQVFEPYAVATVGYLIVNLMAISALRLLERRLRVPGYMTG